MKSRRTFITQLGAAAALLAADADEMRAMSASRASSWDTSWDTSWIERLASAQYRVVFNASEVGDGAAMDFAASFLDDYHEVHGTADRQTRPVIVFRRLGTPMALGDVLWERYGIGEDLRIDDPGTRARATRNVFWKPYAGAPARVGATTIDTLQQRGLISLVCNIALGNWARLTAQRLQRDPEVVARDARANLVPGAILVPSGIYALIRAQNAGCAFMPGT